MDEFKVYTGKLNDQASTINDYKKSIQTFQEDLNSIRTGLRHKISAGEQIGNTLKRIDDALLEEAARMSDFGQALEHIAGFYRNSEAKILSANDGRVNGSDTVTAAQQTAMDQYMQNAIFSAMEEGRFSQETWEKASEEERKEILSDFLNRIESEMGISVEDLEFINDPSAPYKGVYDSETNTITINESLLSGDSYDTMMATLTHEARHAYQKAACENPEQFLVTEETLAAWEDSAENYLNYVAAGEYGEIASEVDAREFARQAALVAGGYVPVALAAESGKMYDSKGTLTSGGKQITCSELLEFCLYCCDWDGNVYTIDRYVDKLPFFVRKKARSIVNSYKAPIEGAAQVLEGFDEGGYSGATQALDEYGLSYYEGYVETESKKGIMSNIVSIIGNFLSGK